MFKALLCCFIFVSSFAVAQNRFLIGPNREVIPLGKGESARAVLQQHRGNSKQNTAVCSDQAIFGQTPEEFPPSANFGAFHKEVLGEWFVAKASGTIDTIFWYNSGVLYHDTAFVRVHRSNISPTAGPGVRPGPYNPPCQSWGYWVNSNDPDGGIAPFIDEATDTNWVSTISNSSEPSFSPVGEELWGLGGVPVVLTGNGINYVALAQTAVCSLKTGDAFFISMKVKTPSGSPTNEEDRTEWLTSGFRTESSGEYYPSRLWKFYEIENGASNCNNGLTTENLRKGWAARGGLVSGGDSLDVAVYNWWYVMTVYTNTPPTLSGFDKTLNSTFDTTSRCVEVSLNDCNLSDPASAGVENAYITWTLNNFQQDSIPGENLGGETWIFCLPGVSAGSRVKWWITAVDSQGLSKKFPMGEYRVLQLRNDYGRVDTSGSCTLQDISATGTTIPPESFFSSSVPGANKNSADDGTAGPISLGGVFNFYGQQMRYAWVGVNGAISLTETASETTDVNSNGNYTSNWSFPEIQRASGRERTGETSGQMPYNFIAPFWHDYYYRDTGIAGTQYGAIRWSVSECLTIFEWDSLAVFNSIGDPYPDDGSFRIVLNRCEGTIQFQYNNFDYSHFNPKLGLTGLQAEPLHDAGYVSPWILINSNAEPLETTPGDGKCFTIVQSQPILLGDKWNLISVGEAPDDTDYSVTHLFPGAGTPAFRFEGSYIPSETLDPGTCYWVKLPGAKTYWFPALVETTATVHVNTGWNMISTTLPCNVPVSSVIDAPVFGQSWFGFTNGYTITSLLLPGHCYWVKALSEGSVSFSCSNGLSQPKIEQENEISSSGGTILISDASGGRQTLYVGDKESFKKQRSAYELPPVSPPGTFDARFASNNFGEVFSKPGEKQFLNIQAVKYPVTICWNIPGSSPFTYRLNQIGDNRSFPVLAGNGSVKIENSEVKQFVITSEHAVTIPTQFSLEQNYPNPFNPTTVIRFSIPDREYVSLKVYNILGEEVATLFDEVHDAGIVSVEFDASNLPSGVYIYRMQAGSFVEAKKLLLMK